MQEVEVTIKRFNPDEDTKPHWETYRVTAEPTDRVLDVILRVKDTFDGSIGFRRSCAHGICGSDAMMINGANALACVTLIKNVGTKLKLEPIRGLPVIKDLIVDMKPFFEQYESIMPYLVNSDDPGYRERLQSPEEHARFDATTKCILCGACTTSCPVYWSNDNYLGPAAFVQAHRFVFDSRDQATDERLAILSQNTGVYRCRTSLNCTKACPRDIPVTQAIQELKREALRKRS